MSARIFHVNVNCSDLDVSLAFYRDELGLQALVRTRPEAAQAGGAFGLDVAWWDAWILAGEHGVERVVLDLLEWQVPTATQPSGVGGLQRLRLGAHPDAPGGSTPSVDPDGTALDIVPGRPPSVLGVRVGCSDLAASCAFYEQVVGLSRVGASTFCDDRGPAVFAIELVASREPIRARVATDVGLYRVALLTDDLDRDDRALRSAGVEPYSPPATLDMGPGLPALRALFFPDPDGTTLELIEQPT
jgi:catechol 2,3-dioxygenase-like lactoylglutathione lyase family enzyme